MQVQNKGLLIPNSSITPRVDVLNFHVLFCGLHGLSFVFLYINSDLNAPSVIPS